MEDKVFDVYITNLGKYNEGYLMGEWVALPTTREELQEVFDVLESTRNIRKFLLRTMILSFMA